MVQFKDISKIFDNGIAALKDINFAIDEGEFVFLIGPSGSGKTTLIEMLIRDQIPSYGKIYLQDIDITRLNRRRVYMLRRQIGVIFQDYKLVPDKTAFENVSFAMEAAGRSNKDIKETVPYLLEIVGLEDRMKAFPHQLSGGEKQRVAIARAIANNPRILIADEPTGNLDPASAWDIVQILTKINNWGTTVIMSTHGTDIVNSLNKRVIQMERGVIVRDDSKGGYELPGESKVPEAMQSNLKIDPKKTLKINITDKVKDTASTEQKPKRGLFSSIFGRRAASNDENKPSNLPKNLLSKFTSKQEDPLENQEIGIKTELTTEPPNKETFEESLVSKIDSFGSTTVDSSQPSAIGEDNKEKKGKREKAKKKSSKSKSKNQKIEQSQTTDLKTQTSESGQPIADSSSSDIDDLELDPIVRSVLIASGYKTIESLIEAGPDVLEKLPKIDPEDVINIAKAIERHLDESEDKE